MINFVKVPVALDIQGLQGLLYIVYMKKRIFVFLKRHSVFAITVGKVVKCGEMCHIVVIRF